MSIGKRLRQAIDNSNQKVTEFSEVTGIPYRTLQQYLSDNRAPASEALTKICEQTNIDVHWLLTGQGVMYRTPPQPANDAAESLSHRHAALLGLFDGLDEKQQREILSIAEEKERLNRLEQMLGDVLKKVG